MNRKEIKEHFSGLGISQEVINKAIYSLKKNETVEDFLEGVTVSLEVNPNYANSIDEQLNCYRTLLKSYSNNGEVDIGLWKQYVSDVVESKDEILPATEENQSVFNICLDHAELSQKSLELERTREKLGKENPNRSEAVIQSYSKQTSDNPIYQKVL